MMNIYIYMYVSGSRRVDHIVLESNFFFSTFGSFQMLKIKNKFMVYVIAIFHVYHSITQVRL